MGSTCNNDVTFSGCLISSAAASSSSASCSISAVSIVPAIILPATINTIPIPTNTTELSGVTIPRPAMTAPTRYKTFGTPNNCPISTVPKSASLDPFVTRIPVDREISREGIWLTRPSPIVKIVKVDKASFNSIPCRSTPSVIPPMILITVMKRPAAASPLTYFTAPSMEPKKLASSCIFSRRLFASASLIAPVFKSASIAICLPGIASSVNLAVTSATRSEPLLMIMNCTMIRMIKTIQPTTISLPPTYCPKVRTTLPGSPVVRISLVEETFRAILNTVVKSRIVGKYDILSTSLANIQPNRTVNATAILHASNTSRSPAGTDTINMINAASTYAATPRSAFLSFPMTAFSPFHSLFGMLSTARAQKHPVGVLFYTLPCR